MVEGGGAGGDPCPPKDPYVCILVLYISTKFDGIVLCTRVTSASCKYFS